MVQKNQRKRSISCLLERSGCRFAPYESAEILVCRSFTPLLKRARHSSARNIEAERAASHCTVLTIRFVRHCTQVSPNGAHALACTDQAVSCCSIFIDRRNGYRPAQGTTMPRQTALPLSLAPRLISREAAAAYICVSPNTFDEMVKSGQMPRARLLGERRRAWDVRQLDIAIDQLPSDGNNTRVDETWSDVDAPQAATSR